MSARDNAWMAMMEFDAPHADPRVGDRVRIATVVRDLAADGAPGYGPMPGDAPGTVTEVHKEAGAFLTAPVVKRVRVAWDEPGATTPDRWWRVGDLEAV